MWTTIANDMGPGLIGFVIVGMVGFTVGIFFYYLTDIITGISKLKIIAEAKKSSVVAKRLWWIEKVLLWISVLAGIGAGYEGLRFIVWSFASNQYAVQAGFGGPLPPGLLQPVESAQQIYAHNIQSIWWGMLYWFIVVALIVGISSALIFIRGYFWTKAVSWVNKDRGE